MNKLLEKVKELFEKFKSQNKKIKIAVIDFIKKIGWNKDMNVLKFKLALIN